MRESYLYSLLLPWGSWPCSFNSVYPNMSIRDCLHPVTQQWRGAGLLHGPSYCWGRARTILQVPHPSMRGAGRLSGTVSPFRAEQGTSLDVFVTIFYVLFQPFRVPVCLLLLCPNKFSVSPLQSSLPQDPQKALPTSPFSERPSLLRWRTQGQGLGPLIAWPIKVAGSSKNPHGSGQTTSEPCPGPLRLSCTVH